MYIRYGVWYRRSVLRYRMSTYDIVCRHTIRIQMIKHCPLSWCGGGNRWTVTVPVTRRCHPPSQVEGVMTCSSAAALSCHAAQAMPAYQCRALLAHRSLMCRDIAAHWHLQMGPVQFCVQFRAILYNFEQCVQQIVTRSICTICTISIYIG